MPASPGSPRAVDHLVLPTAGLPSARDRLSALGFTVAPDGVHPFGTINCCVYLADGTFLEPLAVGDVKLVEKAGAEGNIFVARDSAFREQHGEEGFSAIVLASDDAAADHDAFRRQGLSAGPMLSFSRPFKDAAGGSDIASFRLAFTADPEASDCFAFTCERVGVPNVDRGALEKHSNGVQGLAAIVLRSSEPERRRGWLNALTGAEPVPVDGGFAFATANARLLLLHTDAAAEFLGMAPGETTALALSGIVFAASDPDRARDLFRQKDIPYLSRDNKLIVPPAAGQGTHFLFEAFS